MLCTGLPVFREIVLSPPVRPLRRVVGDDCVAPLFWTTLLALQCAGKVNMWNSDCCSDAQPPRHIVSGPALCGGVAGAAVFSSMRVPRRLMYIVVCFRR